MPRVLFALTLAITATAHAMTTHPPAAAGPGVAAGKSAHAAGIAVSPVQSSEASRPSRHPHRSSSLAGAHTPKALEEWRPATH